jgi:polar amino acid transport system permease protein
MKSKSFLENRIFGHFVAGVFFVAVGLFFYSAAANMNYVWKWTSVPKYFVYDETITIQSPATGHLAFENDAFFIVQNQTKTKLENLDKSFKFDYVVGEQVYKGDFIATKNITRAGPILNGLFVTIKVSVLAALLAVLIGVIISSMKLSSYIFLRDIATVYITLIRGTPLLVQIFLFYFIVANIFGLERFTAGVLSLGVFFGAYMAEVLRGAIQSIDKGQAEAAKSLGLSSFDTMRHIVMPQAIKRALPTIVGEFIALVKDSSLISVISITDLTKVGKEIVANTFSPFETWIVIAMLYLSITSLLSFVGHKMEKRLEAKGGLS